MIYTFSVLPLHLKKLQRRNESAIDLSNVNPARGHKEVRRSTGHIMVTIRYSSQQGSKSRQNVCQVRPPENIGNLSASRRCLWVRTTGSTVWSVASISESWLQDTEKTVCCAAHIPKPSPLYKQWHRPISKRFIKPPFSISRSTSIESECCRLPMASVLSTKANKSHSNQF